MKLTKEYFLNKLNTMLKEEVEKRMQKLTGNEPIINKISQELTKEKINFKKSDKSGVIFYIADMEFKDVVNVFSKLFGKQEEEGTDGAGAFVTFKDTNIEISLHDVKKQKQNFMGFYYSTEVWVERVLNESSTKKNKTGNKINEDKHKKDEDYPFYVINTKINKIASGWEFKEDAKEFIEDIKETHPDKVKDLKIFSRAHVKNKLKIDFLNNNDWYNV